MESGNSSDGAVNKIGKSQKLFLCCSAWGGVKVEVALGLALKDRWICQLSDERGMSWPK